MEDRRIVGARSCNCGDGTDQRVQSLMFMVMMISISCLAAVQSGTGKQDKCRVRAAEMKFSIKKAKPIGCLKNKKLRFLTELKTSNNFGTNHEL